MTQEMEEVFETAKLTCLLGEQIYQNLKENRPAETKIIISSAHIGDTIFLCAFASAYKRVHGYKKILMVVPASHGDMMKLFPVIDYVLPLDVVDMEALQSYIWLYEYWDENEILYAHAHGKLALSRTGVEYIVKYRYPSMLLCNYYYLDLPEGTKPERMTFPMPAFSERLREKYENAVLLMPGAQTIKAGIAPPAFWEALAEAMRDAGLTVYVNYAGREGEILIEGAEPMATTLSELVDLSRYFRGFVGLRSGICDLIAETEARLVAIYPETTPETGLEVGEGDLTNYNLHYLGRTEGIWNLQYSSMRESELIDRILALLS